MARECPGVQRCLHVTAEEAEAGWGMHRPPFPPQSTSCCIQHFPASCTPLHSHLLFSPLPGEVYFFRDFSLQSWHLLKEWLDDLKSWYRWLCFSVFYDKLSIQFSSLMDFINIGTLEGCFSPCETIKVLVVQSCLTLWDPMDRSPPGSSVHGFSKQEYWNG